MSDVKELELYVHIPFCVKKCDYCDFLSFPAGEEMQRLYLTCLLKEIACYGVSMKDYQVTTIFFGGGTPSWISAAWIRKLLQEIRENFRVKEDAEITIECNPGTLTRQKLETYREAGINRLSIGLQSADNGELKALGRIHTWEQFVESFDAARDAGFYNINVDLISGLPHQTAESFRRTLEKVIDLKPAHISVYSLIIEEGTPFYDRYKEDLDRQKKGEQTRYLPDEDEEYRIYKLTQRMLREADFRQYEISNYSRPDYPCRHNIGYWTGAEYLGLGLGASSYTEGRRFSVVSDIDRYLELVPKLYRVAPKLSRRIGHRLSRQLEINREEAAGLWMELHENVEVVTTKAAMEEFMFLGLRMKEGVSALEFARRFGRDILEVYEGPIADLICEGLLIHEGDRFALSDQGMDLGNYCMAQFLLDEE